MQTPSTSSSEKNSRAFPLLGLLRRVPTKYLLIIGGIIFWVGTTLIIRSLSGSKNVPVAVAPQPPQATTQPPQLEQPFAVSPAPPIQQGNGQQQPPPDPNLTLMEEARRQADAQFFKHWRMNAEQVYAFTAENGTAFEALQMEANPYVFPIQHVDKLNGLEMSVRIIYSPRAFRYTKRGRTTDWLSGETTHIMMNPFAPKPPLTGVFVQKRNDQWSSRVVLPNGTEEASENHRTLQDMLKQDPISGFPPIAAPPGR